MTPRERIAQIFLWLFVVCFSLEIGAGLYETLVVVPLWSASPPESVWGWNADPRYAVRAVEKLWRFLTPALGLSAAAALLSGLQTPRDVRRKWLLASTVPALVLVATIYLYFAPTTAELFASQARGTDAADEVTAKTRQWLALNRVRAVVFALAWLASLRALSVSSERDATRRENV